MLEVAANGGDVASEGGQRTRWLCLPRRVLLLPEKLGGRTRPKGACSLQYDRTSHIDTSPPLSAPKPSMMEAQLACRARTHNTPRRCSVANAVARSTTFAEPGRVSATSSALLPGGFGRNSCFRVRSAERSGAGRGGERGRAATLRGGGAVVMAACEMGANHQRSWRRTTFGAALSMASVDGLAAARRPLAASMTTPQRMQPCPSSDGCASGSRVATGTTTWR